MSAIQLICKMKGGSHSYGLATPASDIDYRGIFINTDVRTLVGLERHEHQIAQDGQKDESYTEFRNALKLLRNANTQMVELLYNENWLELTPAWELVIRNRDRLVSSEKLFSCLKGYMQGELRLANGERTGKLGSKRKDALDKYGYSPKNFTQLLRLAWAGSIYFREGYFPVNIAQTNTKMSDLFLEIKTNPQKFTKLELNEMARTSELDLSKAYQERKFTTYFDEALANNLCLRIYAPLIQTAFKKL